MPNSYDYKAMANAIRILAMDAVEQAGSGHPGLPLGAADIAAHLFSSHLKFDVADPNWPDRDRFVLSAGHGSMLLYATLYLLGYEDFDLQQIKNFRQLGYNTAGHPEFGHGGGIETTTGPLGQGFANSVGMAIAERKLNAEFGDDLVDHRTWCLMGDGCLMEGISQEALSLAGHLKLNKLICIWDNNDITIDGALSLSDSTDQIARFEASNWKTISIDGHNHEEIETALDEAKQSDRPVLIAAKTVIGFGAPTKSGSSAVHGAPLGAKEVAATKVALEWFDEPFYVPDPVLDDWRIAGLKAANPHKAWQKRLKALDPEIRGEFMRRMKGELPASFDTVMDDYKAGLVKEREDVPTRQASQNVLEVINAALVETVGGSADLTGSNNTKTQGMEGFCEQDYGGRYIHWGIREHAMAAGMNGIALHGGLIPYGGTFLVFSDYCRNAIRLSALMGQRVIYVMTHDSIGLGEDGPTHQPVEHLASLRAIPNLQVFRPADSVETAECWQLAMRSTQTPSVLALSRQTLPAVRLEHSKQNLTSLGAYEIRSASDDAKVSLFASGSEVGIAIEAGQKLEEEGVPTRVVSVPSFEHFGAQDDDYRKLITGTAPVNIAVEAGVRQGWDEIIGREGTFIGMTGFGASAPASVLFKHFGMTSEAIVKAAMAKLPPEPQDPDEDTISST